ncbi:hypothetical protein [Sphingomonas paucimobilis]|uniref:Uncharacterized protein n=1 Tax=Sphingomonas paucimobilis TaxID=13689 RepID=A0A7Y2PFD2_SPHPI|nr:hypothetical protein [Sphingomonas paucimobilis]NNG59783.1 hypothetical protein [Sphingomonas paucimobilis]
MMIRTRLAKLESKAASVGLSLAVRAWLGEALSPAEQKQALLGAAQPLPSVNWTTMSKETREWLQG